MSACNDTSARRLPSRLYAHRTLNYAEAAAYTKGVRMAEGRKITCPYGHGPIDSRKCVELCAAGDEICHRSGSACAIGRLAMENAARQ